MSRLVRLSLVAGDEPPAEFRIWKRGLNTTSRGSVLFDEQAARDVLAAFEAHGVDVMIDLEHASLNPDAPNWDPDARGWCRLEVRDGELWATSVRWTPDGERRLRDRLQRYISPAFRVDPATRRPTRLANIAITALPATDQTDPLVRATAPKERDMPIDFAALQKACEACAATCTACAEAAKSEDEEAATKACGDALAAMEACEAELQKVVPPAADDGAGKPPEKPEAAAAPAAGGAPVKKTTTTTEYHGGNAIADELASEVARLRADANARDVREIIQTHRAKFTPALERWALGQTPEQLRAFVAAAPARVEAHREPKPEAKKPLELTAEDLRVCRVTGTDPASFLKHKQDLANIEAARAAEEA